MIYDFQDKTIKKEAKLIQIKPKFRMAEPLLRKGLKKFRTAHIWHCLVFYKLFYQIRV